LNFWVSRLIGFLGPPQNFVFARYWRLGELTEDLEAFSQAMLNKKIGYTIKTKLGSNTLP